MPSAKCPYCDTENKRSQRPEAAILICDKCGKKFKAFKSGKIEKVDSD